MHGRNTNEPPSNYWQHLDDRCQTYRDEEMNFDDPEDQPDHSRTLAVRTVMALYDAESHGDRMDAEDIARRLKEDSGNVDRCVESIRRERWVARQSDDTYRLAARGRAVAEYERSRKP